MSLSNTIFKVIVIYTSLKYLLLMTNFSRIKLQGKYIIFNEIYNFVKIMIVKGVQSITT